MASIASQLQAIKSALGAAQEPARRPITRPSVLFDPKEAADIDLRSILPIALSGLEHLATVDERFARYRNTLFSETSLEVNRELQTPEENDKLNKSISTYLRLLAGYLQLPAALKTLEYLIRRYLVHVYNLDELLLCALPYHDTHAFVRIVQLVNSGNSKWAFLDGVKSSGAPPPRSVIVQQCIRDKSVLETLCNYVTPTKEFHHSRTVVSFCTAVIVECLGTIPKLDTDIVQRVLGFVFESLNPAVTGDRDYKAGALMIVGVLATRATLALKLVQNLIFSVSKTAQHDAFESNDLPWLRVTVMAIISLVQSQSIHDFPKKPLMILKEIRDFTGVLSVLASEYNIERFMRLYVESLVDYSASDDSCLKHLIETVEILPMKNSVERIVCKVLGNCMKVSRATEKPDINSTVMWAKKLLSAIERKYTLELRDAIRNFLEKSEINSTGGDHLSDVFGLVFDESKCTPSEICDSNIWFSLDHPKAMVRQSALSKIATSGIFNNSSLNPQKSINMQDAILRSMYDDDLSVVEAALSIEGLAAVASPNSLLKAYDDVLTKCIKIITKGGSKASKSKASDIAISCLEKMVMEYQSHHMEHASDIALVVFRLLIVHPKTLRVNLKALELAKKIQWDFYTSSSLVYDEVTADKMKNVSSDSIASVNMKNIRAFAETFLANPNKHVQWLANSGTDNRFSRTLFLLIVLQALVATEVLDKQASLCQACLPVLKDEWCRIQPKDNGVDDEISLDKLEKHSIELVKHIFNSDTQALNARILVCIFWGLLRVQSSYIKQNSMIGSGVNTMLDDMFLFFITSAGKNIFQKHIQYLIVNCTGGAPFQFISKYFLEEDRPDVVQVESLLVLASIYFKCASSEGSSLDESICMQLLLGFPSVIPPLAHENKDIRSSAIKCVEALLLVWQRLITSPPRNGSNIKLPKCMSSPSFGIFLESLVNQKTMLSSDAKFLPAYISSMLSPRKDMMVPENLHERFDQSTKDALLHFILCSAMKLPPYAKFMVLSVLKGVGSILFQAEDVKSLFFDLLDRRDQHQNQHDSKQFLFTHEMKILCLLLEVLFSVPGLANVGFNRFEPLVKALRVDALCPDDPVVVMPCLTALRTLQLSFFDDLKTDTKEKVLGRLVSLFRSENFEIRNAARDALLRVNVDASTVIKFIEVIAALGGTKGHSKRIKRKEDLSRDAFNSFEELFGENPISSILVSLLDILFLKKDVNHRSCLLQPLFQLLSKLLSDQWISGVVCQYSRQHDSTSETPDSSSFVNAAQQLVLLVLKDITDTLQSGHQDAMFNSSNIELLIDCVRSVKDISTRNHGFLLIASLARACPRLVSESTIDLFVAIGDAIKQDDSHSQHVLEDLLSVLVPCWLSKTTSIEKLLQIFIKALADVAEHRRLTLMVYLLRTLGEESNLSTVIMHLLHSLVERISHPHSEGQGSSYVLSLSSMSQEWEYGLAVNVTDQYSYKLWFPCLSKLLKEIRVHENQGRLLKLNLAMRFILFKLQDTELVFELESNEAANFIQGYLGGLMEEVVLCTVFTRDKKGDVSGDIMKEFRDSANTVLKIITGWMSATTYFRGITQLLDHSDSLVKRKTLGILSETARGNSLVQMKQKKTRKLKHGSLATTMIVDKTSGPYFNNLCLKILELIDRVVDSDTSVKIAAISSLDTLAKEYGSDNSAYSNCLATIVNHIGSGDATISSGLIHTAGSLINVLGSKALPQLPLIMKNIMLRSHQVSRCPSGKYARDSTRTAARSNQAITVLISALTTTEVIVEKLGKFLNPYLEEILDLVVLHPECVANMDAKLDAKAKDVRKLLTEKVPVRLILPPLLNMHSIAAKCGEASLSLAFDMLASLVSTMDRQAVGTYHTKIYEHCLEALDLRRQHLDSLKNINMVEQSIIHAIITLTMKLTEGTFRPLFLRTLEWVESEIDQSSSKRSLDRAIVFYKLVDKLAEQHRSLFTPYFKYLLDGSVQYLSEDDVLIGSKQKKKKAKLEDAQVEKKEKLFGQKMWNLRALILKSLHKCFLYDNDQKILDTSSFQMLLKPIVSQFVVEPPESSESVLDTPSVNEVDETIVLCLGQMAVTARSDVLWKPLNHEVLMQTRSDKVRPKMLGLKVVRYMVQHLKEEYIVLLPETIPFLGELLEDVELPVKTLSQEILKEMETLSGESLRQYL